MQEAIRGNDKLFCWLLAEAQSRVHSLVWIREKETQKLQI